LIMMRRKNLGYLASTVFLVIFSLGIHAQGIYLEPTPTDVTGPARLYVDVSSSDCNCPELLDVEPETNPLYIWTWDPNEARPAIDGIEVTNGEWGNSNDNLVMQQDPDNPNLWYFDFVGVSMAEFYDVPAATLYAQGISFLVKEKNGAPPDEPEQKSPDLSIVPEPLGCFEKVCPFPTTFFQDEYFFVNYDNTQETISGLQNLGPDECYIWYRISINGGSLQIVQGSSEKFQMKFEGDGQFSISMIPEEYFEVAEGDMLTQIDVYITKLPVAAPPFTSPISLIPGCN